MTDGRLELGRFGRSQDLDRSLAGRVSVEGQDEFLQQYGRFGYDADGAGTGLIGDTALRNLTMTPDFPTVAEIAADVYTQGTGTPIDGVVLMDPVVVAQLLRYTGPVFLPSADREVGPDEALNYLLRDQYTVDVPDEQRADDLALAASQAFVGLLDGALPDPIELARDLGPLTGDRRLLVWSAAPEEQQMIERRRHQRGDPAARRRRGLVVHGLQPGRQQDRHVPRPPGRLPVGDRSRDRRHDGDDPHRARQHRAGRPTCRAT